MDQRLDVRAMILSKPQTEISQDSNRFRVVAAGRRFGKSFLSINEMAKFARYPNQRVLYIANTYRQAKQVIWDELKTQLYAVNWIDKVNESDLQIQLINGSRIFVRSAENKEALRGTKYDFIVMDECADINAETWFTVLRPTLSDTGGHAMFIGSPKGRNWFYDLWVQAGAEKDWSSYQYSTLAGGFVPPEEIENAKRDLDERQFRQEYMAQFEDYAGVIFYAFSEHNMRKFAGYTSDRTPLHIGMDFNRSPFCAIVSVKDATTIHVIDEIELYSSNTNEMARELQRRYSPRQIFVYPDATGARRTTNSNGLSDHIILHNAGFIVKTEKTNPPVGEAINSVNSLLCSGDNTRRLFIDPKCKGLREALIKHTYKEGTREIDKSSGYDHFSDCLRYLVHSLFPVKANPISNGRPHSRRTTGRFIR